jgi:hypothetical protein
MIDVRAQSRLERGQFGERALPLRLSPYRIQSSASPSAGSHCRQLGSLLFSADGRLGDLDAPL